MTKSGTRWPVGLGTIEPAESGIPLLGSDQPTVARIWKAFGLKPWQEDTFKPSEDPLFVVKVREIVALYMNPPRRAAGICVDEKMVVQALDHTQPVLPLLPHTSGHRSHYYKRDGAIDLFAALNLTSGILTHRLTGRHWAIEFKNSHSTCSTRHSPPS
jgi:hypothetical protein